MTVPYCQRKLFTVFAAALVHALAAGASAGANPPKFTPQTQPTPQAPSQLQGVSTGLDVMVAQNFAPLQGKRVGVITNQTGVSKGGRTTVKAFLQAQGVKTVAFFAPEHGIDGTIPAGAYVPMRKEPTSGKPVYSLYGPTRKPTAKMLQGLDALVYDIQDIGCRSYTYISTMGLCMQAAGENGLEFFVLDRPNPLGGEKVEGSPLDPAIRSFVGQYEIPYVYGLTAGEVAQWINRSSWIGTPCKLKVIAIKGWRRSMLWADTGLKWVPTSPNIPTPTAAMMYSVTGWLGESGAFNNGVGTTHPFGLANVSKVTPERFASAMNALKLPGVVFEPGTFPVLQGKYKGSSVNAVKVTVTDVRRANLTETGFHLMVVARQLCGRNYFQGVKAEKIVLFDKVTGGTVVRRWLMAGKPAAELIASWQPSLSRFRQDRRAILIYPEESLTKQ